MTMLVDPLASLPRERPPGLPVWHDTRHSAVTNMTNAVISEPVAMSVTGHADPSVFKRYHVRRDAVQIDALARQDDYLAAQRDQNKTA